MFRNLEDQMLDNHTKLVDGGDEWRGVCTCDFVEIGQFVKNRFDSF